MFKISKTVALSLIYAVILAGLPCSTETSQLRKHFGRAFKKKQTMAAVQSAALNVGLQVESEGLFDIVEKPEQFLVLNEDDLQIVSLKFRI